MKCIDLTLVMAYKESINTANKLSAVVVHLFRKNIYFHKKVVSMETNPY